MTSIEAFWVKQYTTHNNNNNNNNNSKIMNTKNKEINFGKILIAVVLFMTMSLSAFSQSITGPTTVKLGSTHTFCVNTEGNTNIDLASNHWGWYHNNSFDITCSTSVCVTITFTDLELYTVEVELYDSNGNSIENFEIIWLEVNVVP